MSIHGRVRVIAALGYPVTQTLLSDALNAAFEALKLDLVSVPFEISPQGLKEAVQAMRSLQFAGASIGMPHKEAILPFLDDLGTTARMVGSADHFNRQGGKLVGHNADLNGGISLLKEDAGCKCAGKKALVLGAGGTARSFAAGLLDEGAEVWLSNRSPERAATLLGHLKRLYPGAKVETLPFEARDVRNAVKDMDVLINATPTNLETSQGPLLSERDLHPALIVVDANVSRVTPLVMAARRQGSTAFTGTRLVFWHAMHIFRLLTGQKPPRETLEAALGVVLTTAA